MLPSAMCSPMWIVCMKCNGCQARDRLSPPIISWASSIASVTTPTLSGPLMARLPQDE